MYEEKFRCIVHPHATLGLIWAGDIIKYRRIATSDLSAAIVEQFVDDGGKVLVVVLPIQPPLYEPGERRYIDVRAVARVVSVDTTVDVNSEPGLQHLKDMCKRHQRRNPDGLPAVIVPLVLSNDEVCMGRYVFCAPVLVCDATA